MALSSPRFLVLWIILILTYWFVKDTIKVLLSLSVQVTFQNLALGASWPHPYLGPSKDKPAQDFQVIVSLHLCLLFFTPKILFMYNCSLKNGKRTFIALPQMVSRSFFFVHFESIATYIFLDMQEKLKLIINDTCCIEFSFERVVALKGRPGHADSWHGCGEAPSVPLTNHTCVNPKIMSKSDVLVIP